MRPRSSQPDLPNGERSSSQFEVREVARTTLRNLTQADEAVPAPDAAASIPGQARVPEFTEQLGDDDPPRVRHHTPLPPSHDRKRSG